MWTLKCPSCGVSQRFVQVCKVVIHAEGGTTNQPDGLQCSQCHADVNTGVAMQLQNLERQKKELRAREQELEASHAITKGYAVPGDKKGRQKDTTRVSG